MMSTSTCETDMGGDTSIPQTDVPKHVIAPIGWQFQVPIPTSPSFCCLEMFWCPSMGMWDIHHPHAWTSPSPKLGDVGHPSSPCLDIPKPKAWGCGTSNSPFLDIPKPPPKLGNVCGIWGGRDYLGWQQHKAPLYWIRKKKTSVLGGYHKTLNLKTSVLGGYHKTLNLKTSVLGGYHKTLNLKNQGWVGIRKWETHRSKNLA
jgi:hypothetical protein